jgi:hypothetical protein
MLVERASNEERSMAPGEQVAPNEHAARQTLWLSIRLGRENWLFEIEPDEDRAIVVGSLLRAHVRINRADIAPVHFHFERERDRVRVCPAYSADLCVNGTRISGPYELEAYANIAFAGLDLEAYVCDIEPNVLEQLDLRDWTAQELPDAGAVLSLPDDAEVTRAIDRLSIAPEAPADETKKCAPLCDSYLQCVPAPGPSSHDCSADAVRVSPIVSVDASPPDDFTSTTPVWSDRSEDLTDRPQTIFARIGVAACERPLVASLTATAGAALLSLAMLAANGILFPDAHDRSRAELHASTSQSRAVLQSPAIAALSSDSTPPTQETEISIAPAVTSSPVVSQPSREPSAVANTPHAKRAAHPRPSSSRAIDLNRNVHSDL